jgi:hypothetical protein
MTLSLGLNPLAILNFAGSLFSILTPKIIANHWD